MKYLWVMLIGLMLTGCLSSAGLRPENIGKIYMGAAEVGKDNMSVPLLEGPWQLVSQKKFFNNNRTKFNEAVLVQIKDNTVDKLIYVYASMEHTNWGYWESAFCNRDDLIHINYVSNYGSGDQDCWGINHWEMFDDGDSSLWDKAYDYIRAQGHTIPETMIAATYRKADRHKLMQLSYAVNPENRGFDPVPNPEWTTNDWNVVRIHKDPAKVKFVEEYKKWAQNWNYQVTEGFEGNLEIGQPY
ncbi:hypothetical protein [Curvivirga sp.]|uniref:hypothetical protein n=1 Tax=Curvivirga sp. TaxID=2856848 RepID=UPI003B5A6F8D